MLGCELGGAYKNVVGLAVGMAVGLGFGDNTTASVITRGLAETARLAMALGANPLTLMGLAGLGDLVATCSSPLSRNRTFGEKLGQGMTTEEIYASTRQVAEGAKSCASLLALAERSGVDARIADVRRRRRRRPDDRHRDDGRRPRPRHQVRDGLSRRADRRVGRFSGTERRHRVADVDRATSRPIGEASSAGARSAQRSSTSSMPTDSRTSAVGDRGRLGLPAPAPLEGRLDAAQRRRVHPQRRLADEQVGGQRTLGEHDRDDAAEAGVAHLGDRRVLAAGERTSAWALAWARSTRRCRVRRPRSASQASSVPGVRPMRSTPSVQDVVQLVVAR